jgi:hypothetical protein
VKKAPYTTRVRIITPMSRNSSGTRAPMPDHPRIVFSTKNVITTAGSARVSVVTR